MKEYKFQVYKSRNFFDRALGLIKDSTKIPLQLNTRFGIHTFGLKESIDILILDNSNRVYKKRELLEPYSFFFWNPSYSKVLELKGGTIKKFGVTIGDHISLQYIEDGSKN